MTLPPSKVSSTGGNTGKKRPFILHDTLIRHENGVFRKSFPDRGNLKTWFWVLVCAENMTPRYIHVMSLPGIFSNAMPRPLISAFLNFSS